MNCTELEGQASTQLPQRMQSALRTGPATSGSTSTRIGHTSRQASHPEQLSPRVATRRPGIRMRVRILFPATRNGATQQT